MKNYFVKRSNIEKINMEIEDEMLIDVLDDSGYATKFEIADVPGWILENQFIDTLVSDFKLKRGGEHSTHYYGIYVLSLLGENKEYSEINFHSWEGDLPMRVVKESIERILVPILGGKAIDVFVPHGETRHADRKNFTIYIWSSPENTRNESDKAPDVIWGIKTDCTDSPYSASGLGVSIIDESTDYAVAELVNDNVLYIHHDIIHHGEQSELDMFNRLLEEVVIELTSDPEVKKARLEERIKNEKDTARNKYVLACKNRANTDLRDAEAQLENLSVKIKTAQKRLVSNIREAENSRRRVEQLQELDNNLAEAYSKEHDRLLAMDNVLYIKISRTTLMVFTDIIFCENPDTRSIHEIGKFRIEIPMNGSGGVRWFNLDRQITGYDGRTFQAPHVRKNGSACLGNTEEVFPELIAHFEFAAAVTVAINFIEAVNTEDAWGKYIINWPLKIVEEIKKNPKAKSVKKKNVKE